MSMDDVVKRITIATAIIGAVCGIAGLMISISGIASGYGSQGTQVSLMGDRVHSLETKMDMTVLEIADLKRQMSVLDSKTTANAAEFEDNLKKIEAQLASATSDIAFLGRDLNTTNNRTTQNTLALAEAYKKFTAVNPVVTKCLGLADELESGFRSNSVGQYAIDPKDTREAMERLNCNSVAR